MHTALPAQRRASSWVITQIMSFMPIFFPLLATELSFPCTPGFVLMEPVYNLKVPTAPFSAQRFPLGWGGGGLFQPCCTCLAVLFAPSTLETVTQRADVYFWGGCTARAGWGRWHRGRTGLGWRCTAPIPMAAPGLHLHPCRTVAPCSWIRAARVYCAPVPPAASPKWCKNGLPQFPSSLVSL